MSSEAQAGEDVEAVQATDDFPYRADDFSAHEAVFNGKWTHNPDDPQAEWQRWAYDLGAARRDADGRWIETYAGHDWENPKNTDWVVYGKPVYAISDGVVVNAWRNAPENPRPYTSAKDPAFGVPLKDSTWLHPDMRAGRIYGAGNFVLVREDDGALVAYAHAQPGTIPQRLCPHEQTLLHPDTWQQDSAVPAAQQVRVKRGDLLFLTGNSGNSSAPHLHVDRARTDPYDSLKMLFRHGTYIRTEAGKPLSRSWTSFVGQQVPGPAVIRPPYRSGGWYAWHGLGAAAYQDRFVHLADSGYRPAWIDGYSVGGKPFFNVVFTPATGAFVAHHGLSAVEYQSAFDKATKDGLRLVHVDSYTEAGKPRYVAVFVAGRGGGAATHGLDDASFQKWFDQRAAQGLSPVSVSTISVEGKRRHTALFAKQDVGSWILKTAIPEASYQAEYDANAKAGRFPYALNAYKHDGKVFYCVAFAAKPTGVRQDAHGMDSKTFQTKFDAASKQGLRLASVAGVDGASSNHRYIAAWRR